MANVGQGVLRIHKARSVRVQWLMDIFPFLVAKVDDSFAGEYLTISAVSRGHDTIEHIYSQRNVFQNIGWRTNAHQIPRLISGKDSAGSSGMFVHFFGRFANA